MDFVLCTSMLRFRYNEKATSILHATFEQQIFFTASFIMAAPSQDGKVEQCRTMPTRLYHDHCLRYHSPPNPRSLSSEHVAKKIWSVTTCSPSFPGYGDRKTRPDTHTDIPITSHTLQGWPEWQGNSFTASREVDPTIPKRKMSTQYVFCCMPTSPCHHLTIHLSMTIA